MPSASPEPAVIGRLALREKFAYGVGSFAEQMIFNPATMFIVFFYTDIVGIAAATVGTLLLFSRVFEFLTLVMGIVVDRTQTRYGRGRPWLLWLCLPFGICAVLLFTVPGLGPTGKIIYAFITYNLALTFIFTAIDIPYTVMLPLITPDRQERTSLSIFRMTFNMLGGLVSFAITLPLVKFFGGAATGWNRSFILFGAVAVVLLLVCFFGTKERVNPTAHETGKVPIKVAVYTLLRNKYWILLATLALALFMMLGLIGSNLYYCRYVLHNVDLFGPMMTMFQVAVIAGMVSVGPVVKKMGKRQTALLGTGVALVGQGIMFLAPANFTLVAAGMIIKGLGFSPLAGTMFAMVADTIEYGEWKHGVRTEGLTFGAVALATKISIGLGNAAVGWILSLGGYVAGAAEQSASTLFAIKMMFLHLPFLMFVLMGLILWIYKLDKEYPTIAAELAARRLAH
ncbi:MAG TPA: MFS transporter [Terriglobales bacterium]|nr:MFS transporter [Terriglobales bacterium]